MANISYMEYIWVQKKSSMIMWNHWKWTLMMISLIISPSNNLWKSPNFCFKAYIFFLKKNWHYFLPASSTGLLFPLSLTEVPHQYFIICAYTLTNLLTSAPLDSVIFSFPKWKSLMQPSRRSNSLHVSSYLYGQLISSLSSVLHLLDSPPPLYFRSIFFKKKKLVNTSTLCWIIFLLKQS